MPSNKTPKPDNLGIAASPGRRGSGRGSKAGQRAPLTPTGVTAITDMYNSMSLTPNRRNRLLSGASSSSTPSVKQFFQPQQKQSQQPPENSVQLNESSSRDSVQVLDQGLATGPPLLSPSQQAE